MTKSIVGNLPLKKAVYAAVGFGLLALAPGSVARAQDVTTIILVRHAEKVREEGVRDPDLTAEGHARAAELVHVLASMDVAAVHSTPLKRTLQTAGPVADHFGLDVITTSPSEDFLAEMVRKIQVDHRGGVVVVVGHSNTTPSLVNALIGSAIPEIDDDKFDDLFIVTLNADDRGSVVRLGYGAR